MDKAIITLLFIIAISSLANIYNTHSILDETVKSYQRSQDTQVQILTSLQKLHDKMEDVLELTTQANAVAKTLIEE